jgi:hypothetical protein
MQRAYYSDNIEKFCAASPDDILGKITKNNEFALEIKQRNTWIYEISLLQECLKNYSSGGVAFEYIIPRIGNRIDNVFVYNGIIYLIEFKVGETTYPNHAVEQIIDYSLDLKYFHKESHNKKIVPILVCTNAPENINEIMKDKDNIYGIIKTNKETFRIEIEKLTKHLSDNIFSMDDWMSSIYMPTPTIIEAAQALYRGHNVKEISRSDSDAYNLSLTSDEINKITDKSKENGEKTICFITGVPGAGKTLAGLNIANSRHNFDKNEHAVFLSGNTPLVSVLREALARDENKRSEKKVKKNIASKKASAFIQNIHHFRDDAIKSTSAPIEKVAIFDEAQRAWNKEQTAKFMKDRGHPNWNMSEPEFLIGVMNRHSDYAVIICLIGGGQEINTGEAGLPEWFSALKDHFPNWKIYVSNQITDEEYSRGNSLEKMLSGLDWQIKDKLHLSVSLRSFRTESVASFVKSLLDMNINSAKNLYLDLKPNYQIMMTRKLEVALNWVRSKARGSERCGIIASSGAKRLRRYGIWVQNNIEAKNWFLNDRNDVRSSFFLEETATEFDIQGLEIDWAVVAWDADFRIVNKKFVPYNFTGTSWKNVNDDEKKLHIKNAYRVLLTRSRQGFIIFIPEGNNQDITTQKAFYDTTYKYFRDIGIEEI